MATAPPPLPFSSARMSTASALTVRHHSAVSDVTYSTVIGTSRQGEGTPEEGKVRSFVFFLGSKEMSNIHDLVWRTPLGVLA